MSGMLQMSEAEVDGIVSAMIGWADSNSDGEIDFDEYKKIIRSGCAHGSVGRRIGSTIAANA